MTQAGAVSSPAERTLTADHRMGGAAVGIAFAVLYAAGLILGGQTPAYDAAASEWLAWYEDSGNRALQVASMLLLIGSALAFVVFLARLVTVLWAAGRDVVSLVVLGAGLLFAASTAIGAVGINQVSAAITFGGSYPIPVVDVLHQSEQFGFAVALLGGGWSAALMIAAASVAARGVGALPGWLATAGVVTAVLLLLSAFFLPMLLIPLWVAAAAVALGRRTA